MLKLAEFFFAMPSPNAKLERIFSLIAAHWIKERNNLLPDTIYNFSTMNYSAFYDFDSGKNGKNR